MTRVQQEAIREQMRERTDADWCDSADPGEMHRLQEQWVEAFDYKIYEAFRDTLSGDWKSAAAEIEGQFVEWAAGRLREKAESQPIPAEYRED